MQQLTKLKNKEGRKWYIDFDKEVPKFLKLRKGDFVDIILLPGLSCLGLRKHKSDVITRAGLAKRRRYQERPNREYTNKRGERIKYTTPSQYITKDYIEFLGWKGGDNLLLANYNETPWLYIVNKTRSWKSSPLDPNKNYRKYRSRKVELLAKFMYGKISKDYSKLTQISNMDAELLKFLDEYSRNPLNLHFMKKLTRWHVLGEKKRTDREQIEYEKLNRVFHYWKKLKNQESNS